MKPFGLTYWDVQLVKLALGSSYPLSYGELGVMTNGLLRGEHRHTMSEPLFRRVFNETLGRGLLCWVDLGQALEHPKDRRYIVTPRGKDALRDTEIAHGGDYSFYKYFQGPDDLDRYMGGKKYEVGISKGQIYTQDEVIRQKGLEDAGAAVEFEDA